MAELAVDLTYGTALIEAARERELEQQILFYGEMYDEKYPMIKSDLTRSAVPASMN